MMRSILTIGALVCLAVAFNLAAARHALAAPSWPEKTCGPIDIGGVPVTIVCDVTYNDCAEYHIIHPPTGDPSDCDGPNRTRWCMKVCAVGGQVTDLACVCDCTDSIYRPEHSNCESED